MEDREALKRQIELLQNLINSHRSVHGDVPSHAGAGRPLVAAPGRGRGFGAQIPASFRGPTRPYGPTPAGYWRKKYSLSNKSAASTSAAPSLGPLSNKSPASTSTAPSLGPLSNKSPASTSTAPSLGPLSNKSPASTSTPPSRGPLSNKSPASTSTAPSRGPLPLACACPAAGLRRGQRGGEGDGGKAGRPPGPVRGGDSAGPSRGRAARVSSSSEAGRVTPAAATGEPAGGAQKEVGGASGLEGGASGSPAGQSLDPQRKSLGPPVKTDSALQIKPRLQGRVCSTPKLAVTPVVSHSTTLPPTPPRPPPVSPARCSTLSRTVVIPESKGGVAKLRLLPSKAKSQFTWVKDSQGLAPNSAPSPRSASATPLPSPARKTPRRAASVAKTTKYTWVSSSSRLPRKPLSPKALDTSQKGGARKPRSAASHTAKHKKGVGPGAGPTGPSQAHSSRYRWKAVAQNPTGVARGGSVYRWTSEKENGPKRVSGPGPPPVRPGHTPNSTATTPSPPAPAGFRLKSRMKIIRRRSFSGAVGSGSEGRGGASVLTVTSRYALRRRAGASGRGLGCSRRAQARGLVSFGRHKLRRLSPTPPSSPALSTPAPAAPRTGSSSSPRSPVGQRVLRTRYKIITRRLGTGPAHTTLSPALTWRAKRLQSARALLQSRLRPPQDRVPVPQPWRGRGMRWIGGALYRVSANKLCRTTSASSTSSSPAPRQRAGRWSGPQEGGARPVCGWDPGRVVQRSLAIVRQARQRKQQRQYCMYYNRFGKCNRGNACPYIHDPDKVAVCTRFLRGTCKQTDGSCPFSHRVSKEKMPVCSYFLRGICNNSCCPYSHVYVSRTAAVCPDFLRGYCPKGEKCKQKHTLLCPDFSSTGACPRGSKCKLQHRQHRKRAKSAPPLAPPKRARPEEAPPRSVGAEPVDEELASSGPEKLPSFISLLSSPEPAEEEEEPDVPAAPGSEVTGKKLQIKPRF